MDNNIETIEKEIINKRRELKEQFLREEISAEEYNRLKDELEQELEKLQQKEEEIKEVKEEIKEINNIDYNTKIRTNKQIRDKGKKKAYNFKINGMECNSCAYKIEKEIKKLHGVSNVKASFDKGILEFNSKKEISLNKLKPIIEKLGYEISSESTSDKTFNFDFAIFAILGIIAILAIYLIAKNLGFQVPEINENISLGLILIVGLLTGFHCVGMCGGFVASYTTKNAMNGHKNFKQHLVYGLSKLASYTIIGAAFGLIGSLFVFSNTLKAVIAILAGVFMIFFALSMLGLNFFKKFQFNPKFLTRISMKQYKGYYKGPLTTGLLNGLMIACGPLQAMYLYAAATGSITKGALSLFVFGIGTLPVMLGFGSVATLISKNATKKILKASAVIVLILGLIMLNRGLVLYGSNYNFYTLTSNIFSPNNQNSNSITLKDGIQEINMEVDSSGYHPNSFVIKNNVPVRWNVHIAQLMSCTNELIMNDYGIDVHLKQGLNVIEFTPDKEGTITFTCGMGMLHGQFIVTNDPQKVSPSDVQAPPQHTCGGSGGGCGCGG